MPMKAIDFSPVVPGRLRAHVDHRTWLLLKPDAGGLAARVDLRTNILEAAGGKWTVRGVEGVIRHFKAHLSVRDDEDVEVAKVWHAGQRKRIELESDTLVLESPSMFSFPGSYRIDGLFNARVAIV